ncbi:MAG TPA: serine acetyltransferase [Candidatus Limnocylindria bacterium]
MVTDRELGLGGLIRSDVVAWVSRWSQPTAGRIEDPSFLTGLRYAWTQLGLRATILYRVSHSLHRSGIHVLPGMVGRLNATLHGIDIPPSVPIGPGLYVPHPFGTVVMARRIGAGATLVSCVTIGMRNEPAFPLIGDNVYVSAGARVLGGITIGNNVAIGANAVVLRDVPDDHVAVGVPAAARPRRSERLAEVAQ